MPQPTPAAQVSIAGAMWLNSMLPLTATASGRPFSRNIHCPDSVRQHAHAVGPRQLARMGGAAVRAQPGRARDHHAADAAELLRDQRGVFQRADADADVDALLEQVHGAVVQQHAAAHARVALQEAHDGRRHVHVAEQHRRRDREMAGGLGRVERERAVGGVGGGQHLARAVQVAAALLGQRDAARGAMEQAHAQVRFEGGQRTHHRRQRAAQRLRGPGQAAVVGDLHEGLHGFEAVHGPIKPENAAVKCSRGHYFETGEQTRIAASPTLQGEAHDRPPSRRAHQGPQFADFRPLHRVRLFLSLLGLPFETLDVDLGAGAHKRPDFLRRNAFGQVPVIEDGEVTVCDSNAILVYLNERYAADPARWYPRDPFAAAQVQRWLSVAAGPLAAGPAVARVIVLFGLARDPAEVVARAHDLLRVMEGELSQRPFLAGDVRDPGRHRQLHLRGPCAGGQRLARGLPAGARLAGADRGAAGLRADGGLAHRAGGMNARRRDRPGTRASARMQARAGVRERMEAVGAARDARPHARPASGLLRPAAVPGGRQPRCGVAAVGQRAGGAAGLRRIRPTRSTCASTRCPRTAIRWRRHWRPARRSACSASSRTRAGAIA